MCLVYSALCAYLSGVVTKKVCVSYEEEEKGKERITLRDLIKGESYTPGRGGIVYGSEQDLRDYDREERISPLTNLAFAVFRHLLSRLDDDNKDLTLCLECNSRGNSMVMRMYPSRKIS